MAGFMAPGLGFASTFGAAIGGAARQANTNIENANAQQAQDEKIWIAKAADAQKQYEAEKKDYSKKEFIYKGLLDAAGGNAKAADAAMGIWEMNPKIDPTSLYKDLQTAQAPNPNDNQSTYLQSLQGGVNSRYQTMQNIRGSLSSRAQKFFPIPQAPSFGGTNSNSPPVAATQPTAQAATQPNPTSANADTIIQPGNGSLDAQIGNASATGTAIPLDQATAGPDGITTSTTDTPLDNTAVAPTASPTTPITRPGPGGVTFSSKSGALTPYQQQRLQQGQASQQLANEKFQFEKSQKPPSPEAAADLDLRKKDVDKYLHDPKTGLQFRYNDIGNLTTQSFDVNSIMNNLEGGLKASAVQPAYDELNRLTSSLLGVDLSSMGVSNSVSDTQTLKKNVANAIIDRLKTLHFGRITNYEAQIVGQGMTQLNNDPNTNLKIALTLQHSVLTAMDMVKQEYKAFYFGQGNYIQRAEDARKTGFQMQDQYSSEKAPWTQIDGSKMTPQQALAAAPPGQWFEDTSTRTMYYKRPDGSLARAGDKL